MNNTHITISITTETVLKTIGILCACAAVYYLFDLVLVVGAAIVIASAIEPLTGWCVSRRVPRVLAVLALYLSFFAVIFFVVYVFVPPLFDEMALVASQIPRYLESSDVLGSPTLKQVVMTLVPVGDVIPAVRDTLGGASRSAIDTVAMIFGGALNFILIVVLSFYLSVQDHGIESFLQLVTPEKYEDYVIDLWRRARRKIGLWMQGQMLLGLLIGVFAYLALSILGMKYALLLALVAAVFEVIPVFGPVMAAVPAVAIAFSDSFALGFLVLGFYIIIQQFENHLIYPLVVRKVVGVPPLLVIIALIVGGRLGGILGIMLSVPVASALMELIEDMEKRRLSRKINQA